mmetsp:Transcript_13297/g.48407  ORF Transcript_13297/g.48407 Transcript_13297/m.48407 type:complete len:509 (+) Transcript_13297:127-1653(+)
MRATAQPAFLDGSVAHATSVLRSRAGASVRRLGTERLWRQSVGHIARKSPACPLGQCGRTGTATTTTCSAPQRSKENTKKPSTLTTLSAPPESLSEAQQLADLSEITDGEKARKGWSTLQGQLVLLYVGFTYATLGISIRFLYLQDGPPSAPALSLIRGLIAASCFVPFMRSFFRNKAITKENLPSLLRHGAELALWNALSQGLLNAGLAYTSASRSSLLSQFTVVATPLFSAVAAKRMPSLVVGVNVIIALIGMAMLALDPPELLAVVKSLVGNGGMAEHVDVPDLTFNIGDGMSMGAAIMYSMYILRQTHFVQNKNLPSSILQGLKCFSLVGFYASWWVSSQIRLPHVHWDKIDGFEGFLKEGGYLFHDVGVSMSHLPEAFAHIWPGWTSPVALGCMLYMAVFPGAVADVLQSRGQAVVNGTQTSLLLSTESLWSALCGMFLLGESFDKWEEAGAVLLMFAVVSVCLGEDDGPDDNGSVEESAEENASDSGSGMAISEPARVESLK